jgi:hypothetical protein
MVVAGLGNGFDAFDKEFLKAATSVLALLEQLEASEHLIFGGNMDNLWRHLAQLLSG